MTSGMWSWKLKSTLECVITHLLNVAAPKIIGSDVVVIDMSWIGRASNNFKWLKRL